jgi:hypothetical protein
LFEALYLKFGERIGVTSLLGRKVDNMLEAMKDYEDVDEALFDDSNRTGDSNDADTTKQFYRDADRKRLDV